MAADKRDRARIALVKAASPTLTIGGMTSQSVKSEIELSSEGGDGVDTTFAAVMSAKHSVEFTTRHIATFLTACGIDGVECTTLEAWYRKVKAYGAMETTGHLKVSYAKGFLLPQSLSASQEEMAEIQARAIAISADGTDPVDIATGAQAVNGVVSEAYTIGPCTINGNAHDLESGELNFGLEVENETNEGGAYPTLAYITARKPVINLTSRTAFSMTDLDLIGKELTSFTWYLRKLDNLGLRDGNSAIKISCTGYVHIEDLSGDASKKANTKITVTPVKDSGAIITIDPASSI